MQPNGPNLNQSSAPVPDYLHLDPYTPQQPKKSHIKLIIAIFVLFFLIVCAVTAALYLPSLIRAQQDDKFYTALGHLMKTSYLHRDITISRSQPKSVVKVSADSDFSDASKPKTRYSYENDNLEKQDGTTIAGSIKGDVVTVDENHYDGRISETPIDLKNSLKVGQWYEVNQSKQVTGNPDVYGVYNDTNNTLTNVIMGNFSSDSPDQIVAALRASGVYTITSISSRTIAGDSTTVYTVKENYQKLATLAQQINTSLKTVLSPTSITSTNTVEIAVSNKTGKITQISEAIKQDALQTNVLTVFSYPTGVSIKIPADVEPTD